MGGLNMNKPRKLDMNKILNKKSSFCSTKKALKDVVPFEWDDDILTGKKKIEVREHKEDV